MKNIYEPSNTFYKKDFFIIIIMFNHIKIHLLLNFF